MEVVLGRMATRLVVKEERREELEQLESDGVQC